MLVRLGVEGVVMPGATRREQYIQALKRNLAAELADDVALCPRCSDGWVLPDTAAGKMGVCPACWNRSLAEAARLATKEIESAREHDAARAAKYRAARKARGGA